MSDKQKKLQPKLNSIYLIISGCILGYLLIINSNYVNKKKAQIKLSKEQEALFNQIISQRNLQEKKSNTDVHSAKTKEVCSHASDELLNYYATNDVSQFTFDESEVNFDTIEKSYMKALIALVENLMKVDEEEGKNDSIEQKNINGELTLRNLISDEDKEYLKIYGNHVLPIGIFIAIGISCIFGYFVCWLCYCCDCCCCCCCCFEKPGCKLPIFIFNYLLYALIISFSIYGMVKSKKIFEGFANIECSLLQFFDQILKGENKETTPKWIGINKIEMFFKDLESTLLNMKEENLLEDMDYLLYNIHFEKMNLCPN